MSTKKIVIDDPKGDYWDGSLVDEQTARIIEARGGCCLPCVPELFKRAGVGGFFKRAYGAGWPLDFPAPRMFCPLTIWVDQRYRDLHWRARLLPAEGACTPDGVLIPNRLQGGLRLTADGGHTNAFQSSVSIRGNSPDAASLGPRDKEGGWTVGGHAIIQPSQDGFFSFSLYGAMPGLRVAWAALSLSEPV